MLVRKIVIFAGSALVMDDEFSGGIELLQHGAGCVGLLTPAAAPVDVRVPLHFAGQRQRVGGDRTIVPDVGLCLFLQFGEAFELRGAFAGCVTIPLEVRPVLDWKDREVFVRIIEQKAILVQQRLQHVLGIPLHTRLHHQLGVPTADIHRIELDGSGLAHIRQCALLSLERVRAEQPVLAEQELPCLAVGETDHRVYLSRGLRADCVCLVVVREPLYHSLR